MYRLLKQYKHTGYFKIQIDDFRERLDIPKSYRMTNITDYVLKPIIKELTPIFKNLNINKVKARKGRRIEYLEFIFDAEKRIHSKRQPHMKDVGKQKQFISREKTPQWLKKRSYHQEIQNEEYDHQFEEKERHFLNSWKLIGKNRKVYKLERESYTETNKQTDISLDVKTPACRPKHMLGFLFYRLCS